MLIVCINYDYMINKFPDAGGTYTYTKEMFGHELFKQNSFEYNKQRMEVHF